MKRITQAEGKAALDATHAAASAGVKAERSELATAVRYTLQVLADAAPGRSVEVRVPPFGAVQVFEGTTHRRGTPPAVIEMEPATWLALVADSLAWDDAVATGQVRASGERASLREVLPILRSRLV